MGPSSYPRKVFAWSPGRLSTGPSLPPSRWSEPEWGLVWGTPQLGLPPRRTAVWAILSFFGGFASGFLLATLLGFGGAIIFRRQNQDISIQHRQRATSEEEQKKALQERVLELEAKQQALPANIVEDRLRDVAIALPTPRGRPSEIPSSPQRGESLVQRRLPLHPGKTVLAEPQRRPGPRAAPEERVDFNAVWRSRMAERHTGGATAPS